MVAPPAEVRPERVRASSEIVSCAKHILGAAMARLIDKPRIIEAAGNKPKRIEEFIGRIATETKSVSIARMKSPSGWVEPGQTPEFDEYTVVLAGMLRVTTRDDKVDVRAGQAVLTPKGDWVQY